MAELFRPKKNGAMRVNPHGHVNVSFEPYWMKEMGIGVENIAEPLTDRCLDHKIDIYAIISDSEVNEGVFDRFGFIKRKAARSEYEFESLDDDAFVVRKMVRGVLRRVIFLNGQTVKVEEDGKRYDLLTVGTNKVPNAQTFDETFRYLNGEGFPAIAEHPLCEDHGGMGKERLEEFCSDGRLLAVEHNAQLTLPRIFSGFPKVGDYTRGRNDEAVRIAEMWGVPIIASDDSNALSHIGTAFNDFRGELIFDRSSSRGIVRSIKEWTKIGLFEPVKGYLSIPKWAHWAAWKIQIKEGMLGSKDKWERKNS